MMVSVTERHDVKIDGFLEGLNRKKCNSVDWTFIFLQSEWYVV